MKIGIKNLFGKSKQARPVQPIEGDIGYVLAKCLLSMETVESLDKPLKDYQNEDHKIGGTTTNYGEFFICQSCDVMTDEKNYILYIRNNEFNIEDTTDFVDAFLKLYPQTEVSYLKKTK